MQRSAAERREAGAEYRAGIDQIGVGDDALGQRRLRFVHEWPDQAVGETLGHGAGRALLRLAVHPRVEAPPGLAAEVAARPPVPSVASALARCRRASCRRPRRYRGRRCPPARSAPSACRTPARPRRRFPGAMPSSTQRIAAIRYGASTRLTRNPGALFTGSGSLSICRTKAAACGTSALARVRADDDLDQHHLRHRIEEMQADEARRVGQRLRDILERNARRVRSRGWHRASPSVPARRRAHASPRRSRRSPR